MAEFISESLISQLKQYLQQKPAREPAVHRGHRLRDIRAGRVNRYRPLDKFKSIELKSGVRVNDARYVAAAAALYNALPSDWHIGADCRGNNVVVTLPFAITAGAGRQITVKDAFARVTLPWTITVNAQLGDTINLAGGVVFGAPNQSLVVVSDGGTNWEVVV